MEKGHPISELMSTTLQKIREMVDVNTIVGTPISTADDVTIIPVSKLSFGFVSGGSDYGNKKQTQDTDSSFGGGSGAGVKISPVAFLVIKDDTIKILPVSSPADNTVDRVVEMMPGLFDKITGFIEKQKNKDKEGF